jgi:hypothetical protein
MTIFHRIEDYGTNHIEGEYLTISFDTKYRGIWQCSITHNGLQQYPQEPDLHTLKEEEQEAVKEIGGIVFYLTHGEWSEGLNAFGT